MPAVAYTNDLDKADVFETIKRNFDGLHLGTLSNVEDISGKISAVYSVETVEGKKYVVKVSPQWFKKSLYREVYCHSLLWDNDIDSAFVVKYLSSGNSLVPGYEIMITRFVAGTSLTVSDLLDKPILKKICCIYKTLHHHETKDFGWFDENFHGMHSSWWDFVLDIDNEDQIASYDKKIEPIILLVKKNILLLQSHITVKPCLLYGDFNPSNFVKTDTSIIPFDLQSCFSGHYLYDYAIALTFEPNIYFILKDVCEEYSENDSRLVLLYAMRHVMCLVAHNIFRKDHINIQKKFDKLNLLLNIYNSLPEKL